MNKLKIYIKRDVTCTNWHYRIVTNSDVETIEVVIDVHDFKNLAKQTMCKDELAALLIQYDEDKKMEEDYNRFVNRLIENSWI